MLKRHRLGFIGVTMLAAWIAAQDSTWGGVVAPAELVAVPRVVRPEAAADAKPVFRQSWVNPARHTPSAHGSAICALPGGDQLAVWYGGSREGAADVALFTARLRPGERDWSPPQKVVDRVMAAEELERVVKKVGNAVVFADRNGLVWMVYVTVTMGGWSGSALNVKTSHDEGRTWSRSRRLTLNPFLNVSSLVRNKPILTTDGRIGLPVYHELAIKYPQMLWLTPAADGTVAEYRIRNLSAETDLIQPTLVPLGGDRVLMLLRDQSDRRQMRAAYSTDNGWTWSEAAAGGLPNPDSAVDALRLGDGRILLVYNDAVRGRENLRLAISADAGRTWQPGPIIESARGKEYSYPCLAEGRDGRIHLTYTWERKRIRHVEFNLAWLGDGSPSREATAQ
ncbi:MAG: exo-alpha-sialidase [Opitutaceae bacterium]|nr:exo-alpha-sialidase [Opitutaceae bacterium]